MHLITLVLKLSYVILLSYHLILRHCCRQFLVPYHLFDVWYLRPHFHGTFSNEFNSYLFEDIMFKY